MLLKCLIYLEKTTVMGGTVSNSSVYERMSLSRFIEEVNKKWEINQSSVLNPIIKQTGVDDIYRMIGKGI